MDSSTNNVPTTPRRSTRLQQRAKTPEPTPPIGRGPQAMAKYNRAKKKMNKTLPQITVTSPTKDPEKEDPVQVNKVEKPSKNEEQKQMEPVVEKSKKVTKTPSKVKQHDSSIKEHSKLEDQKQIETAVEGHKKVTKTPQKVEEKKHIEPAAEEQKKGTHKPSKVKQLESSIKDSSKLEEQKQVESSVEQIESSVEEQKHIEPEVEKKKKVAEKPSKVEHVEEQKQPEIVAKEKDVEPSKADKSEEISQEKTIKAEKVSFNTENRHETYAEVVAHHTEEEQKKDQLTVNGPDLLNTTPNLMDESVISVPESIEQTLPPKDATFSPEPTKTKDSTFSPIADKSLHDSRPHIDIDQPYTNLNITPLPRNITQRTSTPLVQKIIKRDTPKAGSAAISSLAKVLSPKINTSIVQALNETVNGQFKLVNPLERSILKSTRKRSLSMTEGESFVQKRVMFISPKVMDIGEIDERMMQSYIEEKENSRIAQKKGHRKRSLSASETPQPQSQTVKGKTPLKKIPDFKAIHEARFAKMETLDEYKERKAQRAKQLLTPSKSVPLDAPSKPKAEVKGDDKAAAKSKIPKGIPRKPLVAKTQENSKVQRSLKRSMSAEPAPVVPVKKPTIEKAPLSRAMSQDALKGKLKFPPLKAKSQANVLASKTEERREKNMALYKSNVTRTGNADIRKKNENILKGVRLNRRFELLMQNRAASGSGEHADA